MANNAGTTTARVAETLRSTVKDQAPLVAKSLASLFASSKEVDMKDAVELASRRWADPQFRATLLQAVGDDRFLAIGKALGHYEEPPTTMEDSLKRMPY